MFYSAVYAFLYGLFWLIHHNTVIEGRENLPEGGCILCPNHTCLLDPIHVAFALGHRQRPRFMAKAELFGIPVLNTIIRKLGAFPVQRGTADINSIRESMNILKDGGKLLIFPEGTRVHEGEKVDAKAGAAFLSSRAGVPMVPMHILHSTKPFSIVRVRFGAPILLEGRRPDLQAGSEQLMEAIDGLRKQAANGTQG